MSKKVLIPDFVWDIEDLALQDTVVNSFDLVNAALEGGPEGLYDFFKQFTDVEAYNDPAYSEGDIETALRLRKTGMLI